MTVLFAEVERLSMAGKGPEDPDTRAKRIKDEMAFGCRDLGGGISEMFARMPTSWWARLKAAIEQRCDEVFADARAEGRDDPHHERFVPPGIPITPVVRRHLGGAPDGTPLQQAMPLSVNSCIVRIATRLAPVIRAPSSTTAVRIDPWRTEYGRALPVE